MFPNLQAITPLYTFYVGINDKNPAPSFFSSPQNTAIPRDHDTQSLGLNEIFAVIISCFFKYKLQDTSLPTTISITCDLMFRLRFLRFLRTFGIWGAWCKVDYYIVRWHGSIRTTPRGTQDKQPLALTWRELPWASADYKTRHSNIERLVLHGSSREPHL